MEYSHLYEDCKRINCLKMETQSFHEEVALELSLKRWEVGAWIGGIPGMRLQNGMNTVYSRCWRDRWLELRQLGQCPQRRNWRDKSEPDHSGTHNLIKKCEHLHGDYQRGRAVWGGNREDRGINGDGRRLNLGWWIHKTIHRWCTVELYAWNLYNFINQCHPNKFSF